MRQNEARNRSRKVAKSGKFWEVSPGAGGCIGPPECTKLHQNWHSAATKPAQNRPKWRKSAPSWDFSQPKPVKTGQNAHVCHVAHERNLAQLRGFPRQGRATKVPVT